MTNTLEVITRQKLSLDGEWSFTLDPEKKYKVDEIISASSLAKINVPGSWEEQGFGKPSKHNPIGAWKKLREYEGTAWYVKDVFISKEMKDQSLKLVISGVRWMTKVWINGRFVGEGESLLSDHVLEVSDFTKVGESNQFVICVNNEMNYPLHDSHIHSYHTATNWGGITGGVYLEAMPEISIHDVKMYPRLENRYIDLEVHLKNSHLLDKDSDLSVQVFSKNQKLVCDITSPIEDDQIHMNIPLWDDVIYWDDQNPYLYQLSASIIRSKTEMIDQQVRTLGIREIKAEGKQLLLNNEPKFLRGYVDCCIFPQTGYPSWNKQDYVSQFKTVKSYGFNHVRLHGWTPPKPFWEAADEEGMLVQTELPHWSNLYHHREVEPEKDVHEFLTRELYRAIESLNEHPSFVLLALGNELVGPQGHEALNKQVELCRSLDSTRLYTDNTGFGRLPAHDREGDFFIPSLNAHPPLTNNYAGTPNTSEDYNVVTMQSDKPILAHEHGQFTMYVRPQEAEKYTGILRPHWLNTTMATLEKKGQLSRIDEYIEASGTLQARAYKENIERARRTSGLAGIQLLDIRDFPGQGHATTGILDAFWDNKGTITPEKFRAFNDEVVILMRSMNRTHYAGEKLRVTVDVSNFSNDFFKESELIWELKANQQLLKSGIITVSEIIPGTVSSLAILEVETPSNVSESLNLSVKLVGTKRVIENDWEFWTYKRPTLHKDASRIWSDVPVLKNSLYGAKYQGKIGFQGFSYKEEKNIDLAISDHLSTELLQFLLDGGKAWIIAEEGNQFDEVKTRFLPIFWNYIWFPAQIGTTMGMIIHDHPSLKNFPHDGRSNWNWFYLVDRATAMNLETVPQVKPIVEVIDNHNRGKHLAYSFETKVGEGSLYVTTFNILNNLKRPEVEFLLHDTTHYLLSDEFNPTSNLTVGELLGLFKLKGKW
ncbi:glycoside hydrolase family 2 protein [Litchfieldia alkalitelluris]|uniref:glycoside hydrolase family 2 protein n=1 Tax=Litchfieldia alkalitelluris TaxID=304268 RepID=UPI000997B30D|nr:sugar-binding domain-containing protein [Litchfieldia alkalitelluris]